MSPFCNSVESSITLIGMFQNAAPLETSRNSLLSRVLDLQSTKCNASKNKLPTKFLESVLKIPENFQEAHCNRVRFSEVQE